MTGPSKTCVYCGATFARRRFASRNQLEPMPQFMARSFCNKRCSDESRSADARLKRLRESTSQDIFRGRHLSATEVASEWGLEIKRTHDVRAVLASMLGAGAIEVAGHGMKNERVYMTSQRRLPLEASFESGSGLRRETCRKYDECLDKFDRENPNTNSNARCPKNCAFFDERHRDELRAYAMYGTGMSPGHACEVFG